MTVRVSECWKSHSIADCIENITDSVDQLKSMTLIGCWKALCPVAINNLGRLLNQQDEIRNTPVLALRFREEIFADLERAVMQEVLRSHAADLTD
jgi:hypothetical protein